MIAETANLTTAPNVVKEAARDHNGNGRKRHRINRADVMEAAMTGRELNKISRCLTQRLSGERQRTIDLKLPVYGGPE